MAKDSSKKKQRSGAAGGPRPVRDLLGRLIKAPAALSILWPALLFLASYLAWQNWGAERVATRLYGIDRSLVRLNEPPDHIREDIVETVYRDSAMGDLSLLDPRATARIASAFSIHPWVRKVVSVRKRPQGRVEVLAEYRYPVAMVIHRETSSLSGSSAGAGPFDASADPFNAASSGTDRPAERTGVLYLPVDRDGIVLPTDDFARAETRDYIHIDVPGVTTAQKFVGESYGDRRVEAAARLAAVLSEYRERIGIRSIAARADLRGDAVTQLELTTFDGKRVFWGSPPGQEGEDEAIAAAKVQSLLDTPAAEADLRRAGLGHLGH